ncbi:MAG TPA: acyltransferase [Acidimicrobiales bacterium]|nr:acyltransferase [Acidimicrobiales bacterium]
MNEVIRKEHFGCLDALRGLAAFFVVVNHLGERIELFRPDLPAIAWTWLTDYTSLGVLVFFGISGFVIAHSLRNVVVDSASFGNFMTRRVVRLTPPYYAALALALVVNAGSAYIKNEDWAFPSAGRMIAHLLYLPDLLNMEMINGVHWTLYVEVQFYLSLCALVWVAQRLRTRSASLSVGFMALCGTAALTWPLFALRHGREHYFLPYWYSFLLGVFLYWHYRHTAPRWLTWSYLGLLGMAWALHQDSLVGASFLTGVFIVLASEKDRMQRWLRQRPWQFLGKISYSLYLTHSPIVGAVFYAGTKAFGDSRSTELLLIVPELAASLVVGTLAWWFVERPAIQWSKGLRRARPVVVAVT